MHGVVCSQLNQLLIRGTKPPANVRTYLITGAAGFIGSHLADELLAAGDRVIAIDDLSTGRRENIAHLEHNAKFDCVIDTVSNKSLLQRLVERADAVFHLAAAVGVRLVVENPVRTILTNVAGTAAVLAAASKHDKPVLIASSSEVYGKSNKLPFREDDDVVLGDTQTNRWSYGCSKALDEFLALAYAREQRLKTILVRLFNTAGPRQSGQYGMVLPRFVRCALAGEPLTIYGSGMQRRCFCHVADVVRALMQLIDHPQASGRVFNVGTDEEVSIGELAERVRHATASNSELVNIPYDRVWGPDFEDMERRVPDLTRVRDLIGFRPTKTLDEIIASVVAYERSVGAACKPRAASGVVPPTESAQSNRGCS